MTGSKSLSDEVQGVCSNQTGWLLGILFLVISFVMIFLLGAPEVPPGPQADAAPPPQASSSAWELTVAASKLGNALQS